MQEHPTRRTGRSLGLKAATALLVFSAVAPGSPVINDAELESKFTEGLTRPGVDGLNGAAAAKALAITEGKTVAIGKVSPPPAATYEDLCRSVVVVGTVQPCEGCGGVHMGAVSTGWIIGPRGHVVTNYHVLEDKGAAEIGVMTSDGTVYPVSRVLAADRQGDAVILGLESGSAELPALALADEVRTGEAIRVLGHPDGRFYSLTEGIVSRVFTEATGDGRDRRTWVSVTADYGGGSSGAPVLNAAGEVAAMVSSTSALLADPEEGKDHAVSDVQMVFRDCVSVATMRRLLGGD